MKWYHSYKASSFRRILTSAFVFACLLGAVGHAGLILCVGECGGSQIESALEGCCNGPESERPSPRTASLLALATSTLPDGCGACVDIPLVSPSFNTPPAYRSIEVDAQACAVVALLPHAAPQVSKSASYPVRASALAPGSPTSNLRSTIILI